MVQLVGILNLTPDSFSDGNLFYEPDKALRQAKKLFDDGASLVDVGAESTRPGATPLTAEAEWQRLEPVIISLVNDLPGKMSVDTYHAETAERVLGLSQDVIINNVTGMNDPKMIETVAKHKARCIISHLKGTDIQLAHLGKLVSDINVVRDDLLKKAAELEAMGITRDKIILDPGIGFGKTPELNSQLLEFAREIPDYKVMIGYSRKRFLGENRMDIEPNVEAGRIAIKSGAAYLRVHDVAGHKQLLYY